ncbi:hypothetical protein C5O00_09670 [Pukyongia salina]|uniref:Glycosyltransferase n=1 Tax=Pukyongia salina TaxID=2094025 RepID=A0A2S0HXT0_9FLAO|nr:hypothetical protein [Pukyongia salina]AVI51425.1 hypothetical protein C5O00_09670 [Pukyongia salina]
MYKIIHIINPVKVGDSSDLKVAQPVTFESLRIAKSNVKKVEIFQLTAQYEEDKAIIPDHFIQTKNLRRSVIDIGNKDLNRKLPLIKDILKRAFKVAGKNDFIIYTNVDIAVQPGFYNWIIERISEGVDAMIINRRTISDLHTEVKDLPKMYAEKGEKHPGYDCFVFQKKLGKKMMFGNICVGAVYIGLVFFLQMKLLARNFMEYGDEHLTFHIGNDQVWRSENNNVYAEHNKLEFEKISNRLRKRHKDFQAVLRSAFPNR